MTPPSLPIFGPNRQNRPHVRRYHRHRRRAETRSAFTVLELLLTLALLTVAALVAVRITSSVIRISRDAPAEADRITRQARTVGQLRSEIFSARTIDVTPRELKLTRPPSATAGADNALEVLWQLSPDGTLTRRVISPSGESDWQLQGFAPGAEFSAAGDIVRLKGDILELTFIAESRRLMREFEKGAPR